MTEHMADGRTRVEFDNGDEHRYRPSSLHKLNRFPFAVGKRVRHGSRGDGTVTEHMENGKTKVKFDSGEEREFKPRQMRKFKEFVEESSEPGRYNTGRRSSAANVLEEAHEATLVDRNED